MRLNRWAVVCTMAVVGSLWAAAAGAQDQAKIEQGKKVYVAQKCRLCHSIEGDGAKKGPLDGVGTKLKPEEIHEWIVNAPEMTKKMKAERKPVMKNFSQLPKDDVDALVAYLSTLKKS